MEYSTVVDFFKKLKKQKTNKKNTTKIYKLCFGKKRPQWTEEKSSVRTGRLLTHGGQWDSYSGAKEYFGTFKIIALNWKTLEALGCDMPLSPNQSLLMLQQGKIC